MSNITDELDKMLQGNDNPPASSAQNSQQNDSSQGNPIEQQSEEEVEFNKLDGKSQDRFKQVWARARQAEEALESERTSRQTYVPPAPGALAPDQKTALETLSNFGVATDEKVDRKVAEATNRVLWEMEQKRLEVKYTGENGEPQYVREEIEDYIRKNPKYAYYAPEDVFRLRFADEFDNQKATPTRKSSSLRPTKVQMNTAEITPDNVEEMVKTHSEQWYDDHIDEINSAVTIHTRQFDQMGNRV